MYVPTEGILLEAALKTAIDSWGTTRTLQYVGEYIKPLLLNEGKILEIYLGEIGEISAE